MKPTSNNHHISGPTPVSPTVPAQKAVDVPAASQPTTAIKAASPSISSPIATVPAATSAALSSNNYQVNEQFSGSSLNQSLWTAMTRLKGYRNNEEQDYSPGQVSVADGNLRITAARDQNGNWHSGEVNSKWNYTYGEFEVRLALSAHGPGVWPAAWMMGASGQWPTCGEIDMLENINNEGTSYGTIHGGGSKGNWFVQHALPGIDTLKYHTYKIIKQPNYIAWWVDGVKQAEWNPTIVPTGGVWPFESNSNIAILNLAIGGTWPGPSTAATPSNITMLVDYFTVKNAS
jgi:beta-glucanase (GH16 family)